MQPHGVMPDMEEECEFDPATLSHYLITEEGRAIKLPLDRSVFFGRGEGNLMQIPDDRVSRQHAELCWDGDSFVLTDLNSTNGTRVNCEFVERRELEDDDFIQIGVETYVYRIVDSVQELALLRRNMRQRNASMETSVVPELQMESTDGRLTGKLQSLPVAELIQMLNSSRRTGLLVIQGENAKAFLYFFKGEVTQAEHFRVQADVLVGDEAVMASLRFRKGTFVFKPDRQGTSDNVEKKIQFLLLEAARMQDETDQG